MEPAVLSPNDIVRDLDILRNTKKISGVPVTIDGRMGSKLVGLISNRDTDFLADRSMKIGDLMTPIEKLVTGLYPLSIEEANVILKVIILSALMHKRFIFCSCFSYYRNPRRDIYL